MNNNNKNTSYPDKDFINYLQEYKNDKINVHDLYIKLYDNSKKNNFNNYKKNRRVNKKNKINNFQNNLNNGNKDILYDNSYINNSFTTPYVNDPFLNNPFINPYINDQFLNDPYFNPYINNQPFFPVYDYPYNNYQSLQYYSPAQHPQQEYSKVYDPSVVEIKPGNYNDDVKNAIDSIPNIETINYEELVKDCLNNYESENNILVAEEKMSKHIIIPIKGNKLSDLLEIVNTYEYNEKNTYNIDMKALSSIKNELIQLNSMIGIKELKDSICQQLIYFIQKLHINISYIHDSNNNISNSNNNSQYNKVESSKLMHEYKHTVLYGPPGTGKTEIAKIIGTIYSKIGILSKNIFKKVSRSDLVAGYLGQTAIKTKTIINECLGGVLFIDEAYSLGSIDNKDSYSKECIDTLCESLSNHKDDLMVIVAGYENDLNELFFSSNKGLDSRFIWRFKIDEYSASELNDIFLKKINETNWEILIDKNILYKWFNKNKTVFENYGRDVELLFTYTKIVHSSRVFGKEESIIRKINIEDLDKGLGMLVNNKKQKKQNKVIEGLYI
jgi:hypothetical protein